MSLSPETQKNWVFFFSKYETLESGDPCSAPAHGVWTGRSSAGFLFPRMGWDVDVSLILNASHRQPEPSSCGEELCLSSFHPTSISLPVAAMLPKFQSSHERVLGCQGRGQVLLPGQGI